MSLIPWPYGWLALVLLAAALIGFGWIKGAGHVQAQWDAAVQQQTLQAAAVRERQAQATVKVVTEYVRKLPRQADTSKVEPLATCWRYSAGVRLPSDSWGRCSL